jgi:hypothetical protein
MTKNDILLNGSACFDKARSKNIENQLIIDIENNSDREKLQNQVAQIANVATIEEAIKIIEDVLPICGNNPEELFSAQFLDALRLIKSNPQLWATYRTKLKAAKPSAVLMADIDQASAQPHDNINKAGDSVASELIELVKNRCELFFDTQANKSFVSLDSDGVTHTLAIGSRYFIEWLSYAYYKATSGEGVSGRSASEAAIRQASFVLAGIAKHEGHQQTVHLRVSENNGCRYIFLADDRLRVIEISPTGWKLRDKTPIKFWKPSSMQPLPIPQIGGDFSLLWQFINIPENSRLLVLAWILETFRAETPKPILALCGTQGSAKSSTQSKLRQLIDNNTVNLRAAPKSVEDVFVSAGCNWLVSFENLSKLTPQIQDALCTLATGGGFATRTLYTNADETIIEVKRPVIINSIPNVITAQDLSDRAISIELPSIIYREETEINFQWNAAKSSILGGLLDLFVSTMAQLPYVKLINPPRMADFTKLGEAMAQVQGYSPGTFEAIYKANRAESIGRTLESSPVAVAICEMAEKCAANSSTIFYGTVKSLLEELALHRHDTENWPKSPKGLSDVLKRQSPALAALGIEIISGNRIERVGGSRGLTVTIKKHGGNFGNVGNMN